MRDDVTVLRGVWTEVKAFFAQYSAHRDDFSAAALAFYVALALAPAAIAFGAVVSLVLPADQVKQALTDLSANIPESATSLRPIVASVIEITEHASSASFTITTVVGTLLAIYAASRFTYTLRIGLDVVHGTAERHLGFITRIFSALITLALIIIGAAALVAFAVLPKFLAQLGINVTFVSDLPVLGWLVSFLVVYLVITLLYRFGPHQHAAVGWLNVGAAFATGWLIAVSVGVRYYAAWSTNFDSAIALLGIGIGLIFWLYVVFIGFFLGAELEVAISKRNTVQP